MTKIVGFQSGHDVSYCILENGIPILCEELERMSRTKLEIGDGLKFFFSRLPIHKDSGVFNNIKHFTHGNYGVEEVRWHEESNKKMHKILNSSGGQFWEFGHHLSHAANAFFTSGLNRSLIIAMDGGGWEREYVWTELGIYEGVNNKVYEKHVFPPQISLGTPWCDLTGGVFGLSTGYPKGDQAGTVMAMAALGKPKYLELVSDYAPNLEKLRLIVERSEQEKFDVAASLQEHTENTFKKIMKEYIFDHENLCLSGGVSLNCVMLAKIKEWFPHIKNLFCDPVPYDAGLALGSARYLWHHVMGNPRINKFANMSPFLGRSYSKKDIDKACNLFSDKIKITQTTDDDILDKLYRNKVIAVFGGGSETGRRALGNRSILANPINKGMKAHINAGVKHRQWFRPLAPSILEEKISEWFTDKSTASPYMSFALSFRPEKARQVPAVVHYDGTARLQTVNKLLSPWFHKFLTKWEILSGVPILLNTSFNDNEPIVETPVNALNCFLKTEIDFLYFFDYGMLVEKR